jgi:hypothetical protein
MGIEHGPTPEEMGLREEEESVDSQETLESNDKNQAVRGFEKYHRDVRSQVGARDNEPMARAWFRKKFGWPKDPEQGS